VLSHATDIAARCLTPGAADCKGIAESITALGEPILEIITYTVELLQRLVLLENHQEDRSIKGFSLNG